MKLSYSFAVSFLLHLVVLSMLIFTFHFSTEKKVILGDPSVAVVRSYVFHEMQVQKQKMNAPQKTLVAKQADIQIAKKALSKNSSSRILRSSASQGQSTEALLALLHEAIQAKQRYPENALELAREGRVKLAFTLYKNGSITQLRVVKSSGTDSLDQAALTAVQEAVPFQQIDKFLAEPTDYAIDVVFKMG